MGTEMLREGGGQLRKKEKEKEKEKIICGSHFVI
jgi:hypothetical protein